MPKAKCLSREFGAILIELSYLGAHCLSISPINPRIRGEAHSLSLSLARTQARTRAKARIKRAPVADL